MLKLFSWPAAVALISVVFTILMAIVGVFGHNVVLAIIYPDLSTSNNIVDIVYFVTGFYNFGSDDYGGQIKFVFMVCYDILLVLSCSIWAAECAIRLLRVRFSTETWFLISYVTGAMYGVIYWYYFNFKFTDWLSLFAYLIFFAAIGRGAYGGAQIMRWRRPDMVLSGD
jgi:hypothetical protein